MPIYESKGTLTGTIAQENLAKAQEYLVADNMTQFLPAELKATIEHIDWKLGFDGGSYTVRAYAARKLTEAEHKTLADWTSGQNSDGLGEGFEQQDFAWIEEECDDCEGCAEYGGSSMISFDWKTNDSRFTMI